MSASLLLIVLLLLIGGFLFVRVSRGVGYSIADVISRTFFAAVFSGVVATLIAGMLSLTDFEYSTRQFISAVLGLASFGALLLLFVRGREWQKKKSLNNKTDASKSGSPPEVTLPIASVHTHKTFDVFISYKREDRADVQSLAKKLTALKLTVWFDAELQSGTSFDSEIERNVRNAKCVLVCWSPGAATSEWVRAEATIGRQRGVLAAIMLKECDLPPPFNLIHTEYLPSDFSSENSAWLSLLNRIGSLVGRPGIASYAALDEERDPTGFAAWIAHNRRDPLFDEATTRLKQLD